MTGMSRKRVYDLDTHVPKLFNRLVDCFLPRNDKFTVFRIRLTLS